SEHQEWDENNTIDYFNSMSFNSLLHTTGTGYNGKIGLIYRPINLIRLGASVHTPTFYNLTDVFETSMVSSISYDDGDETYRVNSPWSEYGYSIETPLRAN